MKFSFFAGMLFFSLESYSLEAINPKVLLCSDMQSKLEEELKLYVRFGFFNVSRTFAYSKGYLLNVDWNPCRGTERLEPFFVKDSKKERCRLGYYCFPKK